MTPIDPPSYQPTGRGRRPDGARARRIDGRPTASESTPDIGRDAGGEASSARRATARRAGGAGAAESPRRTKVLDRGEGDADPTPPVYVPRGDQARPGAAGATPPAGQGARPAARPAGARPSARPAGARTARPRGGRRLGRSLLVFVLVLLLAWPLGLGLWANARISHTDALPPSPATPGTTYLLAGSDSRADGTVADGTPGERADTIMLLHKPASGPSVLISLPRDTYVEIPGHGANKLNAAYSLGGPALLAETVEELTGIGVDHYVEVGMGGVTDVVDSVGGVNLCLDYDVSDEFSGLQWQSGCHDVDGTVALQFARMRYSDPQGDIGRGARQRQVLSALTGEIASPATVVNPARQVAIMRAGTGALLTDPGTGILDLGAMALAFRSATGPDGLVGAPPIASLDYHPGGIGSAVLLDEDRAPQFWSALSAGTLTAEDLTQAQ